MKLFKKILKNPVLNIILIFVIILTTLFLFKKIKKTNFPQTKIEQLKPKSASYLDKKTTTAINNQEEKIKENLSQKKGKMFFAYKKEVINQTDRVIYIDLAGDKNTMSDAVDLFLIINENVEVKKIINGNSFNFYPRKIIDKNHLIITGVALDEKGEIKLAQTNSNFIKIYLSIKNLNKKTALVLNKKKSRIFSLGEDITDDINLFEQINL